MAPPERSLLQFPHTGGPAPEDLPSEDVLEEFAPYVRQKLESYRDQRKLSSLARALGFHVARLTEMITRDEKGVYRRKVTPYYLAKFIEGGIVTVEELLQGHNPDDLDERVRIFFERMALSRKTIRLVAEAQQRGIDVDRLMETILKVR
ncbi:MAG: hypothetical protein PVG49_16685 [Desulfobacteraceae bacterium]|jgi:hypothetical protein